MRKLLNAGFTRLFRLKSLYISFFLIALETIPGMVSESILVSTADGMTAPFAADPYLSGNAVLATILAAVVTGNLIGSEYGFGTMRNKLAAGHKRTDIYFSNCIVSTAGTLSIIAFSNLTVFAVGLPLGVAVAETLPLQLLTHLIFALVISSLYVLIAMNIRSKSNSLTVAIILGAAILFMNVLLMQQLSEPEFVTPTKQIFNEEGIIIGEVISGDPVPNIYYAGGAKRVIMETADMLLPTSAVMEYGGRFEADKAIAEICETIVFTAAGVLIFRKRDLK